MEIMQEIETRALVADPLPLKRKLLAKGFIEGPVSEQLDMIFDYPDARMFRSGRKVRIRIEGDKASLTYKGPFASSTKVSRREEIEIPINREFVPLYSSVFEAIGIPLCFQIPKVRHQFRKPDVTITFDEWPIIGCLMELEGSEENVMRIAKEIAPGVEFRNFRLKELFFQVEQRSKKSLTQLQREYERLHNVNLGHIDLVLA
jgi:predicted adenylyl cyclase CyaB